MTRWAIVAARGHESAFLSVITTTWNESFGLCRRQRRS
jgi:hypothetical protein